MPRSIEGIGVDIATETDKETDQILENLNKVLSGDKPLSEEMRMFLFSIERNLRMQKACTEYFKARLIAAYVHLDKLDEMLDRR